MKLIYTTNKLNEKDIILLLNKDEVVVSFWEVNSFILEQFLNDEMIVSDWAIHDPKGVKASKDIHRGPILATRGENGLIPTPEFQSHIERLLDYEF